MSNTAPAAKPRTKEASVSSLDTPVTVETLNKSLAAQKQEILNRLEEVRPDIESAAQVAKKHPGVSHEITRLHAKWKDLLDRVDVIDPEVAKKNRFKAGVMIRELEDIRQHLEVFDDLEDKVRKLHNKIDDVAANQVVLANHTNGIAGKHNHVVGRVRTVEGEIENQRVPLGFWVSMIIVSALIGFFVWVAYSSARFTDTQKLPNGTKITYLNQYNQPYYAWLLAAAAVAFTIIVFVVVEALIKAVRKHRSRSSSRSEDLATDEDVAELIKFDNDPDTSDSIPTTPSSPEDVAPTRPIPAKGATSGAH